jgi:hypothetical protein
MTVQPYARQLNVYWSIEQHLLGCTRFLIVLWAHRWLFFWKYDQLRRIVRGFLRVLRFPHLIKTVRNDKTEILSKVAFNAIRITPNPTVVMTTLSMIILLNDCLLTTNNYYFNCTRIVSKFLNSYLVDERNGECCVNVKADCVL